MNPKILLQKNKERENRVSEEKESRGTQREYSSKPPKDSIVKRILVFKRQI